MPIDATQARRRPRRRGPGAALAILLAWVTGLAGLAALTACGPDASPGAPATTAYDGPLHLPEGEGRHPRAGAAGDVVDCDAWGTGGAFHGEVYVEGATSDSPAAAARTAAREGLGLSRPRDLRVAAESEDRVLYVVEVDGRVKAALIVRDGQGAAGTGGDGWYPESWAECDLVELPADLVEEAGRQIWTDTDGRIVPSRRLTVFRGAEHCDWQRMTFLSLGRYGRAPTFVRDPAPFLAEQAEVAYLPHTRLPADSVDSGFRRGPDRLWLAPDRSLAYVGASPGDVERWPRLVEPPGCL